MRTIRYLVLALLAAWLLSGLARVRPEERAVVRRFGQIVAHPQPGLWFGLPWGIDRVDRIAVRSVRQLIVGDDPERSVAFLTGDQNLVDARVVIDYAIGESDASLDDYVLNRETANAVISRESESLLAEWFAGRGVDEALLTGRAELPLWLMQRLPARIQQHRLGIVMQRASVEALAAPPEVREAFEAVNQAQAGIRTRESAAVREAETRMQQVASLKYQLQQQAAAYRVEVLSAAKADAQNFTKRLEQYRKVKVTNPDALASIWWDEMGRTLLNLKTRGRLDLLDAHLGKDGLDITQFLPPKK